MKDLWANIQIASLKTASYLNRNTGFIILLSTIFFGVLLLQAISGHEKQQPQIDTTNDNVLQLLEDNKRLTEQGNEQDKETNRLADRQIFYQKCLAHLFAQYTRDNQPIEITDISRCEVERPTNPTPISQNTGDSEPPNNTQTSNQNQQRDNKNTNNNQSEPPRGGVSGALNRAVDRIMRWF